MNNYFDSVSNFKKEFELRLKNHYLKGVDDIKCYHK